MGKSFIIDGKMKQTVEIVTDILATPSIISVEHSDVKAIMGQQGAVFISTGSGAGKDRVLEACQDALTNLRKGGIIKQATKVLVKITGPLDLLLKEVNDAMNIVSEAVPRNAEIFFGVARVGNLHSRAEVTLLATAKRKTGVWSKLWQYS